MEFLPSHQSGTVRGRIALDDPEWSAPIRGVRLRGGPAGSHRELALAVVRVSGRQAVACDLTAAYLWSAALPSGFGLDVDAQACAIATISDGSRHRHAGVRGRRLALPEDHLTELEGVRITTPARTWLDCAQLIKPTDVVAMGDALIRSRLASRADLEEIVLWGKGRRGVRPARTALPILDPGAESPPESWTRALLIWGGVPSPVTNFEVEVAGYRFRLDLAWIDERVAVEYDGQEHHGPDRQEHDAWRRRLLRAAGWTVIVITKEDFAHFGDIIVMVNRAVWSARSRAK
jgi:hypothetical protein